MQVSYHVKISSSKNNKACLIVIYFVPDDIGTINRMLKHRGVNATWLHIRNCEEVEYKNESGKWRIHPIYYKNYEKLIRDELIYCTDSGHFKRLAEIKNKYKNIFND